MCDRVRKKVNIKVAEAEDRASLIGKRKGNDFRLQSRTKGLGELPGTRKDINTRQINSIRATDAEIQNVHGKKMDLKVKFIFVQKPFEIHAQFFLHHTHFFKNFLKTHHMHGFQNVFSPK